MKTLTVDDSKRIQLPDAKPRQVFAYEPGEDGSIKLVPVVPQPGPRTVVAKLVRRHGRLIFEAEGVRVTPEAIAAAVREERDSR